ncbi:hypothetical protein [Sinorhizobium meliloti]|uniref:hypothetical protein n=1 Tax=Rhizobium meliloti TaxID=382 RepID=UPI000FD89A1C|nr:hypothetical protein [Sinorhizobium meliloti]RVQ55874.1 hypothetical protein CN245_16090 [Sinorhizobium meliloti]
MKLLTFMSLMFVAAASSSFAETTTVHAFIGTEWMETKANALEVTWSSELEGIEIHDEKVESSSPFLLRCGDDGRQYVMISIPAEDDIWPTVTEDVRATADVMAFGSDLEITGVPLSSMKAGSHRLFFVDLGTRISEFVRHWYSGMSVRVATKPGQGLVDLNFIVAAPLPDAGAREKFAETIALCQIFAR